MNAPKSYARWHMKQDKYFSIYCIVLSCSFD
nr:MAG TPA: hypothetical protein [Bacteriophage sp.]